jgi:hypothetical protein
MSLSGTDGPEVTEIGTTGGDGSDVRITCVHGVLMLCSSTLVISQNFEANFLDIFKKKK